MRSAGRAGFTLVEVLLVLMIMAGLLVAIAQVLTAARTSRDTIHNVRETQLAGPAILDLVERDLRSAFVLQMDPERTFRVIDRVIAGLDADRLDFVTSRNSLVLTAGDSRFLRADVNEVGYCLRINPQDNDFLELYRREDFGVDDEPLEGGRYTFLHDRVVGFDIRLFEEDGPDTEELDSWGTQADELSGLPVRIEIDLSLELAPRLMREQLALAPIHARRVTHRRVIRLSQLLRDAQGLQPVPVVPDVRPAVLPTGVAGPTGGPETLTGGGPGEGGLDFGSAGQGSGNGAEIFSGQGQR